MIWGLAMQYPALVVAAANASFTTENQRERLDSHHATNAILTGNDASKGVEEHQIASLGLEEHQLASLGGDLVLFEPPRFGRAGDRAEGDGNAAGKQGEAPPGGELVLCNLRTPSAPYEKSKSLGSGGSMVARLALKKETDGRAPPGVEPAG
ncbi:rRNA intron-encoded homing endonuclease [Ectocarpus siliculosus]|uniref:rRNA intron-encoded homing endonuclease n=1 Tax=Ectocarpus siliculosus TaxID=2880 RepID=D7G7K9_ECTSI|nr:rRNA intron-encoded homing endonuclease [Ectocarpus siliculosus]|eukprot:CBJ27748.1 rRNA intron-encoded homing endonuclease [Ectocarpus siliculosus]